MKPYKLEIKILIFYVSVLVIFIFTGALLFFGVKDQTKLIDLARDYSSIIFPITLIWVLLENRIWRMQLMQNNKSFLNIPPDFRGRWEGEIESSLEPEKKRKFVIEVQQTLTKLQITSFSEFGNSRSILAEIGSDEDESIFSLCFLWQGEISRSSDMGQVLQRFNGYTMLHWDKSVKNKKFAGTYFTDLLPSQTHGKIELTWVSFELQNQL